MERGRGYLASPNLNLAFVCLVHVGLGQVQTLTGYLSVLHSWTLRKRRDCLHRTWVSLNLKLWIIINLKRGGSPNLKLWTVINLKWGGGGEGVLIKQWIITNLKRKGKTNKPWKDFVVIGIYIQVERTVIGIYIYP
jgi:hypothetical protein